MWNENSSTSRNFKLHLINKSFVGSLTCFMIATSLILCIINQLDGKLIKKMNILKTKDLKKRLKSTGRLALSRCIYYITIVT